MADSERALGRLDRALAIVQEPQNRALDRATQIELAIVESGIRRDQGMADAALLALQVPELSDGRTYPWSARLFYAYADALLEAGRRDEARDWFARAAAADAGEETDAAERFEYLDDVIIEDLGETDLSPDETDLSPDEPEPSPDEPAEAAGTLVDPDAGPGDADAGPGDPDAGSEQPAVPEDVDVTLSGESDGSF
jgi:tetratricopeptide (TPR) repeat protein